MIFRTDEDYESVSRAMRAEIGVDDRYCVDVLYCAKRLKEIGRISDFKIVPDAEMPRDNARYEGPDKILVIPSRTFFALDRVGNTSKERRRHQRFTMAHEFAHIAQDAAGVRYRGPSGALAEKLVSSIRLDEIQANRFASSFLVPARLADRSLPSEKLSEIFDVNPRVARIRSEQLERLDRRANNRPRALPPGVTDFLRSARDRGLFVSSLDVELRRQHDEAVENGFETKPCSECGNYTLKYDDSGMKCDTCGSTTARS